MKPTLLSIFLVTVATVRAQSGVVPIGGPVITAISPAAGVPVISPAPPAYTAAVNSLISIYGSALASSSASASYSWPLTWPVQPSPSTTRPAP